MKRSLQSLIDGDLEQALDFIAERAVVGRGRRVAMEKAAEGPADWISQQASAAGDWLGQHVATPVTQAIQSRLPGMSPENTQAMGNAAGWGLGGMALGAGLGGVSSMFQKKKRPLSSMLSGAMLGGALGAGGSLLHDYGSRMFGGPTPTEQRKMMDEASEKADTLRATDLNLNAAPGFTEAAKQTQLPDDMLYEAARAANTNKYGPKAFGALADAAKRNNWGRVVGKDRAGNAVMAPYSEDRDKRMEEIYELAKQKGVLSAVPNYPRLAQLRAMPGTISAQYNQGDYTGIGKTLAYGTGLRQVMGSPNSEGIWKDTQRLLGGGPELTDQVRGLFTPVPGTDSNVYGIDPVEATEAARRGPEFVEALWRRLKGSETAKGYSRFEPSPGQTDQYKEVPWADQDRPKFDQLMKQIQQQGGAAQWPSDMYSFGNSFWDTMAATGAADVAASNTLGRLPAKWRGWPSKYRATNPQWIRRATERSGEGAMPSDLQEALRARQMTGGDDALRDVMRGARKGRPFEYGGGTLDQNMLKQVVNQTGAGQPDLNALETYLQKQNALPDGQRDFGDAQLKLLQNTVDHIKRFGDTAQQQAELQRLIGGQGLTGGGRSSLSHFDQQLGDIANVGPTTRHPMEDLWRVNGNGVPPGGNAKALSSLKSYLGTLSADDRTKYMGTLMGTVEKQLASLPPAGKGQQQLINVPLPHSNEMLRIPRPTAEAMLGRSPPASVSAGELARLANVGPGLPGRVATIPEIVELARQGQPIPGATPEQTAEFHRLAATGELGQALNELHAGGPARPFGRQTVSGQALTEYANRAAEEEMAQPSRYGFLRRNIFGLPEAIPASRWAVYPGLGFLSGWAFDREHPVGNAMETVIRENPQYQQVYRQPQGQQP